MLATVKSSLPESVKVFLRKIKNSFSYVNRESLAYHYIKGNGIEIGALHNPLKVKRKAKVKYVDRYDNAGLKKHYPELSHTFVNIDIVDNGELLSTVADQSQDFVIANHFLEHCQNPLQTLSQMYRVLKKNGILYLALPDKRFTFDLKRPITSLEHLLKDFHQGPEGSKRQHFEEWVNLVNNVEDKVQAQKDVEKLIKQDYSIHFHVWTQAEILEMFLAAKKQLNLHIDIEACLKNGIEFITILRRTS